MSITKRVALSVLCSLVLGLVAKGQATRTPFSMFGVGEYYGNSLAHNQGMAGVGISNGSYFYLNNKNPALLVYNRLTVFESGVVGEKRTIKDGRTVEQNGSGNLNYLALGFPVMRGKWSTSTGLMPYTNVNYKLNYTDNIIGSSNQVAVAESGSGGINKVFWSNGVALNEDFSLGATVNYLFGSINSTYTNRLIETQQTTIFSPTVAENYYYKDYNFSAGFSYHKDSISSKNYHLNFGLVYDFRGNVNTYYSARITRLISVTDTIKFAVSNLSGNTVLPQALGAGISFGKGDNFTMGADVQYLDYSQFRDVKGQNPSGQSAWRFAVGAEVTPTTVGQGGYLMRMTYRTGVSLDQYPYLVNGNTLKDFGINFGLSLPVGRVSSLDLGLKVGKRGDLTLNKIEENYIKLYFGVTFNDQWFIKRRFD